MVERTSIRNILKVGVAVLSVAACEQQSDITEGTVYKKEHINDYYALVGKAVLRHQEKDKEAVSTPPTHEEIGESKEWISRFLTLWHDEHWKVYIAKCQNGELPSQDKIEIYCKTASFDMPQEAYPSLKIGQHANFKRPK